jgi:hypothetical protein
MNTTYKTRGIVAVEGVGIGHVLKPYLMTPTSIIAVGGVSKHRKGSRDVANRVAVSQWNSRDIAGRITASHSASQIVAKSHRSSQIIAKSHEGVEHDEVMWCVSTRPGVTRESTGARSVSSGVRGFDCVVSVGISLLAKGKASWITA